MRALSHLPVLLALLTSVDIAAQTGPPNQQVALDFLYAIWQEESQPDSIRADAYVNYITRGFLSNDPDSAFSLAEQLIAFVPEKKYIKGKAQGIFNSRNKLLSKRRLFTSFGIWRTLFTAFEKDRL